MYFFFVGPSLETNVTEHFKMADPGEHQILPVSLGCGLCHKFIGIEFNGLIDWLVCFCLDGYDMYLYLLYLFLFLHIMTYNYIVH